MRYITIALLVLPLVASAQVKRCPDGSYSDQCADGVSVDQSSISITEGVEVREWGSPPEQQQSSSGQSQQNPSSGMAPPVGEPSSVAERARAMGINRNDLVRARNRGNILMGMEQKDVFDILGSPDHIERSSGYGTTCTDLFWYNEERDYIAMCDGRVEYHNTDVMD